MRVSIDVALVALGFLRRIILPFLSVRYGSICSSVSIIFSAGVCFSLSKNNTVFLCRDLWIGTGGSGVEVRLDGWVSSWKHILILLDDFFLGWS